MFGLVYCFCATQGWHDETNLFQPEASMTSSLPKVWKKSSRPSRQRYASRALSVSTALSSVKRNITDAYQTRHCTFNANVNNTTTIEQLIRASGVVCAGKQNTSSITGHVRNFRFRARSSDFRPFLALQFRSVFHLL